MSAHPYDLKAALLASRAQHVALVHFPIGLFFAAVLFDLLARWKKNAGLGSAAYFNFLLAAISTVPTLASGVLAWQWALAGQPLKGILRWHLAFGWLSAVLLWMVWLLQRADRCLPERARVSATVLVELLALLVVALTGHLGGFLSGVNGVPAIMKN